MDNGTRKLRISIFALVLTMLIVCLVIAIGYVRYSRGQEAASIINRATYVVNYDTNNHSTNVAGRLRATGYFTQKLYDYITRQYALSPEGVGQDSIICAQALPDSWSYGTPQFNNNRRSATLHVTGNYSVTQGNQIDTSWVKAGDLWQEDSITCHD